MHPIHSYDIARQRHSEMIQHAELMARVVAHHDGLPAGRQRYRRPSPRLRWRRETPLDPASST